MYVSAQSLLACLTLCNPMDCSPPGSSVHVILQDRILEWVALPSSRGSSWPMDQMHCRQMLSHPGSPTKHVYIVKVKVLVVQSCLILHNPVDRSPPGSSVHVILQARILEWVAWPLSRRSSWPMDLRKTVFYQIKSSLYRADIFQCFIFFFFLNKH